MEGVLSTWPTPSSLKVGPCYWRPQLSDVVGQEAPVLQTLFGRKPQSTYFVRQEGPVLQVLSDRPQSEEYYQQNSEQSVIRTRPFTVPASGESEENKSDNLREIFKFSFCPPPPPCQTRTMCQPHKYVHSTTKKSGSFVNWSGGNK